jgi:hypothetical protein
VKLLRVTALLLGAISLARAGSSKTTFYGEISDTQCAMNVHSLSHSHKEMVAKQSIGTDAASCARECVRRGGEWVLRAGETVYRLKNQNGIEPFAGQQVQVTGTLDSKAQVIDNQGIATASRPKH